MLQTFSHVLCVKAELLVCDWCYMNTLDLSPPLFIVQHFVNSFFISKS